MMSLSSRYLTYLFAPRGGWWPSDTLFIGILASDWQMRSQSLSVANLLFLLREITVWLSDKICRHRQRSPSYTRMLGFVSDGWGGGQPISSILGTVTDKSNFYLSFWRPFVILDGYLNGHSDYDTKRDLWLICRAIFTDRHTWDLRGMTQMAKI